jgi:hypothetical protein
MMRHAGAGLKRKAVSCSALLGSAVDRVSRVEQQFSRIVKTPELREIAGRETMRALAPELPIGRKQEATSWRGVEEPGEQLMSAGAVLGGELEKRWRVCVARRVAENIIGKEARQLIEVPLEARLG